VAYEHREKKKALMVSSVVREESTCVIRLSPDFVTLSEVPGDLTA
jgi:hypothetical protein